jgi:hypothetical protein
LEKFERISKKIVNVLARLAPLRSLLSARRPHPPRFRYFFRARFLLGFAEHYELLTPM